MNLGEKIRIEMKRRKLTFEMLSKKTGISQGNLSSIVTGKNKNPGIFTINKIAKEFNQTLDQFVS